MIPVESESATKDGIRIVYVAKENTFEFLKEKKEEGFDTLLMISGVDYRDHLEVLYHLLSSSSNDRLIVKTKTEGEVESITPLWKGANWHERETWDLVGIKFKNHPNLTRILLTEGWTGHPLRKDYPMEKKQYVNLAEDGEDRVSFENTEGY